MFKLLKPQGFKSVVNILYFLKAALNYPAI